MTRTEFEALQSRCAASGQTLKAFLLSEGISYSTYHYWRRKCDAESDTMPLAPIRITEPAQKSAAASDTAITADLPGVTLAFPNDSAPISAEGERKSSWKCSPKA